MMFRVDSLTGEPFIKCTEYNPVIRDYDHTIIPHSPFLPFEDTPTRNENGH